MARPRGTVLGIYHREALELFVGRGRNRSDSYDATYLPEKLADTLTSVQKAVADRVGRHRWHEGPFRSANALREAASATALPDGRTPPVSRNQFEAVVAQPTQVDGRLGPVVATATRTIGEAIRCGLLLPPISIMTVTRTVERRHLRYRATLGGRPDGLQDQGMVVGPIMANQGGSFAFASHSPTQDRGDVPASVLNYHEARTGVELNPLTARMGVQLAVWQDLNETMGVALPIVNRGERRFAPVAEGTGIETSDEIWYPAAQAAWYSDVAKSFPPDAIVLGEVPPSWLEGMTYRSVLCERRISNPKRFLEDVELKLRMLSVRTLAVDRDDDETMNTGTIVTLEGRLIASDDSEYVPVIVTSAPHPRSVVYVIPAERAASMDESQWEATRTALIALHGPTSGRASDDQGRGLSLPLENGFAITSSNPDKAGNYDVIRFFSHAIESPEHWRSEDGR